MKPVYVDFRKTLTYHGEDIFEIVKTKTNKYYMVDSKTSKIVANTKGQILKVIKEWGLENLK